MSIYIVTDLKDNSVYFVYDENTFKEKYINFISSVFKNKWMKWYSILKYEINSDKYEEISVDDILKIIEKDV